MFWVRAAAYSHVPGAHVVADAADRRQLSS